MENTLVVSHSKKSAASFADILKKAIFCDKIVTVPTGGEARRVLLERDFDLCIINAPLPDESGESLSRHAAAKGICQVLLAVKSEYYDEMSDLVEDFGVITIAKPINKNLFWNALKLAKAAHGKMMLLKAENTKLIRRIEDIRIVDRAKCILISYFSMSEPEAHKYIEKQAMDMRITRRAVAEGILKTYSG